MAEATPAVIEQKPIVEAPVSPNAETDKRVTEVLNDKKKKKHPVEARIADLTKKAKEAEEQAKKDKAELEAKLAEQNEKNIQAELERRKAQAAADDKRPEKAEGQTDADFAQKMAEWVIRQQDKITPKIAAKVEMPPAPDPYRKEEFDGFLEAGKEFIKRNPDFNDTLKSASERGLNLDNQAMVAIIKLKAPQVAYYLAKPENETVARNFMKMDGFQQSLEVARIAERLTAHPNDFVSSAGKPGIHIANGQTRADLQADQMEVDDYLRKRKQDIKAGLRRR